MNLTILIKRIKLKIGIYGLALPIDNLDQLIIDIITDITLPVFSRYCPFEQIIPIDMNDLEKRNARLAKNASYEEYLLPDFQERKLLSIKDIYYDDRSLSGMGYWGGTTPMLHSGLTNQMMLANASVPLLAMSLPKMNFWFEAPRTVRIFNCIASHLLMFDMLFEHDKSLGSITPTSEESFFNLAILDVKENLYGLVKHYTTVRTVIGEIELKIDDWADAANERKDLLNQWDDTYHLDLGQMTWS